ncbi:MULTISPECIES: amino acid adenylation domain-containing protein [unclassified Thioalkalivibrio]|uniref:amino acid adenylation domain-containing protein n=1 Tax=unclassified Thioalkalivibrio TaxID=2621013 RepID=UPI000372B833|nr:MULTISPECIES: amino acid adenylation domain-containing protein [unclassified Thioalkalivibrio]
MAMDAFGLHAGFLSSARGFPERPALDVEGSATSYRDLYAASANLASDLQAVLPAGGPHTIGILAQRSRIMYQGLLGVLMAGHTVVPLNPSFPSDRTRRMIELAELAALVVDATGVESLDALLGPEISDCAIWLPTLEDCKAFGPRWPGHAFHALDESSRPEEWAPAEVNPDDLACLFFTSGSTGVPKGVGVRHRNAARFVAMSRERYDALGLSQEDRFSQFYDITFDSSMFDLYVGWAYGACLCCPSAREWFNPNRYIVDKALTVIDITPSAGHGMSRRNGWAPGRFPQLRLCRFGGEALSAELARIMESAAPNAAIDNAYGPTECTVDACFYRWDPERSPAECIHGMAPIGYPGNQVGVLVVDEAFHEVPEGGEGELLISGPQVSAGYWKDPERTAAAFIRLGDDSTLYYRTGDLVRCPYPGEPLQFLGRFDHQIKIGGVRIELGEIEQALREAAATDQAVAIGWPRTASGASGIIAFVVAEHADVEGIREKLRQRLPTVMVPREIHLLDELPLNANGKVDRKMLVETLQAAEA